MTTQTGAEGLDLECVRQVHIMEPYWQPVLLEQVIGRGISNCSHTLLTSESNCNDIIVLLGSVS